MGSPQEARVPEVELIQRQVDAYNKRDLEAFLATYSDTVKTFRMPAAEPATTGKAQLGEFYSKQRFNLPGLRAEILNRIVVGNKVIDHERVWGIRRDPIEVVAVYQIVRGLIECVWFYAPD
jgi:hypothetical protein